MAKFLSAMFSQVAGSIGGMTFTKMRGIHVVKQKPKPPRRLRTAQPANRALLGWLSRLWGYQTEANRTLWNTWASNHPVFNSLGQQVQLDGHQAFIQLNHLAVRLGGGTALSSTPPLSDLAYTIDELEVTTGITLPGDIDLNWTAEGGGDAGDYAEIRRAGPFTSPGRVEVDSKFAYLADVAGNVETYTDSGLVEGMYYWYRVRYVGADGQRSAWQTGQATPMPTP